MLFRTEIIYISLWIYLLAEICIIEGVEYLHENGVLHRDLKPENLVMDSRGYVRITDLGVARI